MGVSLRDLLPPKRMVNVGGGELGVDGINLEQMVYLFGKYKDQLQGFFAASSPDFAGIAQASPTFVTEVICMASDSVGQEEDAAKFTISVQIELLLAIWELSVPDLKKLVESLSTVAAQVRGSLQSPSTQKSPLPEPLSP